MVVNPFLVYDQYLLDEGKDTVLLGGEEDFVGWCILDSLRSDAKRTDTKGLQGTPGTTNFADYGVRLFLNVCASYLKA